MAESRRIALVCPNYHPRTCGVGDFTMRLAEELQRRGFECRLFTRTPAETNPEAPAVRVVGVSGRSPLLIAEGIRRELKAFAPTDLVLQYTPQMFGASRLGSWATLWLAEAARLMGVNVVVLAHEMFLPWSARPDLTAGAVLMRVQFAALMKIAHRVLVTVGTRARQIETLAKVIQLGQQPGVVRIGSPAAPKPRLRQPGRLRLGVFSTLAADKRFDVVLDCFRIVSAADPTAELVILGDLGAPTDGRVQALMRAIAAHPASGRIRVLGKQTLEAIAKEIAALDVYLFPMTTGANTRSSTLPLALGTGIPSVAVNGTQTDDIFVDGTNVVYADAMTGPSFATAALKIARDPALAARVSDGALDLYRNHLTWERIGDQLLAQV
jgi:glycosyltransferase involved in cell wall biosynthesis